MQRVFISYPKSGRTWFRYIFTLAGLDVTFSHAGAGTSPSEPDFARPTKLRSDIVDGRTAVFLHRNPIDTAISMYFELNHRALLPLTWARTRTILSGRTPPRSLVAFLDHRGFGVERVCQYNRCWLDHLASLGNAVLVVTYEGMTEAPVETLGSVLGHYDPNGCYDVRSLVEQAAFERMQAAEAAGTTGLPQLRQKRRDDPDSRKVRRGKIRGYRDYLSQTDQIRFEAICERYGLERRTNQA